MSNIRVGADLYAARVHAVAVTLSGGRPLVTDLYQFSPGQSPEELSEFPHRIRYTVPDIETQIKPIVLPAEGAGELCDRIAFELTQSLLEEEELFTFDFHPVDDRERYLGLIYRRDRLGALHQQYGLGHNTPPDMSRFLVRSLALGRGYLTFCRRAESGLTCVVDLAGRTTSVCFVYGDKILDLAALDLDDNTLAAAADREQFAIDLKTVVSYRLTSIMEAGVSLPLSSVILLGDRVDDPLRDTLAKFFPVGVNEPEFHRGYFAGDLLESQPDLAAYLAALGLTVN